MGFVLCWNWHIPGAGNGPVDTPTPVALGGTKRAGNKGNKTQAVCLKLLQRLPTPLTSYNYHVFLDNLFVSAKFVAYARTLGFGVTGTCRTNSGIIQDLLKLKQSDKNDVIPWGTLYSFPTEDCKTLQIGWKDQAFVLFMTSVLSPEETVERYRKRPKETSSKAKTSRAVFAEGEAVKKLPIPIVADSYNHKMGAVDVGDQLIAQNPGLRHVRRGGHQAIEHWLLRLVLVNSYLLAQRAEVEEPRKLSFRSQQEFRRILVSSLICKAEESSRRSPKRRVSIVSQEADSRPPYTYQRVKMAKRGWCVACKGGRVSDRPQKRVALGEIAANRARPSKGNLSWYGCKECAIHLCKIRPCFAEFHRC
jgi:hypothetical protein